MSRVSAAGVLSRGRGSALAYRSAPYDSETFVCDAAGQRLARTPLPRAPPAADSLRVLSL